MIRDSVLAWGSVALVIILAFILIPTYERFKDAQGREVDVDPNAPPMPEWLKPLNARTGVREGLDTPVTTTQLPPGNVTVSSSTPSGSKAMASQSAAAKIQQFWPSRSVPRRGQVCIEELVATLCMWNGRCRCRPGWQ